MANLVGYGRVSGEGQRDNTSLTTQKEAIKDYCRRNNHKLIAYYEDVESGSTIELREGFQWALETVYAVADGLIVFKHDRLTRSVEDGEKLKRTFAKYGKQLLSVNDAMDTESTDGAFVYTINSAIAELERKRIVDRCHRGREKVREQGGWLGGAPPYGYQPHKKGLIEVPCEQKTISLIMQLYYEGFTLPAIAEKLNELNIPTKRRSPRGWRWQAIKRIVDGEPEVVVKLRENGKILPASYWETTYGKTGHTGTMGAAYDGEIA